MTPSFPLWGKKLRNWVIVMIVVIVAASVALGERYLLQQTWRTDSPHEELLGVSEGETLFNDPATAGNAETRAVMERINRLQSMIRMENQRVANAGGPYVKVVLLMPLTVSKGAASAITLEQIEHSLQGSYVALVRANNTSVFGDHKMRRLQLLLANQGSRQDVSAWLMDRVLAESEKEHPLVGVVGLGSNGRSTEAAVRRLGAAGIPMVSAITSADSLTGLPNFWSVSPSNIQYARALRHYLDARKTLRSALIVYGSNSDPYTDSLFMAYSRELVGYVKFPALTYAGAAIETEDTSNLFAAVVANICTAVNDREDPLDTVLYAGHGADFPYFAQALKDRPCNSTPLTVLAADTGFASADSYTSLLKEGNVTVVYATSSDPDGWQKGVNPPPEGFQAFLDAYKRQGFDPFGLKDGMAIAHHDELAVLAAAARMGSAVPRAADIPPQLGNLVLAYAVRGASGSLSFPAKEGGRAVGRMIPIKQLGSEVLENLPVDFKPYRVP